jgi:hypothetical protein
MTRIHQNSLNCHGVITQDGTIGKRKARILEIIDAAPRPLSDWEILQRYKPGSDNLNLVQPRITEMYNPPFSLLEEGPPTKSHMKNCNVRTSRRKVNDPQQRLL